VTVEQTFDLPTSFAHPQRPMIYFCRRLRSYPLADLFYLRSAFLVLAPNDLVSYQTAVCAQSVVANGHGNDFFPMKRKVQPDFSKLPKKFITPIQLGKISTAAKGHNLNK